MLIGIALAVIAAAALLRLAGASGQVVKPQPAMATSYEVDCPGTHLPPSNRSRVSYGSTPGALVFGWPAKGGVCRVLLRQIPAPPWTRRCTATKCVS
ncbi:hypothetical protein VTI74DRAFT_2580 [Chaetomium olivicolor]